MNNQKYTYRGLRHFLKVPLILFCLALQFSALHAQNLYTNSTSPKATAQNTDVSIATALTVGTGTTPLTAATVSISSNFVTGQDVLKINGATSGTDGSISFSYNTTTGVMTLTGAATEAEYQSTFRKITYTNTAASPNSSLRTITFSLNAALPYSGNGHFYEYKSSTALTWAEARDAAAHTDNKYFGLQGYLVTSTSAGENTFISSKLSGNQGWLGASDAAVEGEWRWVTGPEAGTKFWQGSSGGTVVTYANWNTGEPNDSGGDEDYGQFVSSSMWNDLPSTNTLTGYVVEYGGMVAGDLDALHISDVVSVNVVYNPTSITASAATICNGYRTTLTAQGAMGTVYWYTGSCEAGTLVTTGNPITVSPTSTTTYYAKNYNNAQYSTGCASIEITVTPPSFTPSLTVASLAGKVTGENIKWYANAEGGSPLENSASISNGSTYHASQTVNGIESTARKAVTVSIDATPCAPTGAVTQSLGAGSTVANLAATGASIRWYTESSGGTYLDDTTPLQSGTHTYYASQTVNCTESANRLAVSVTVP